MIDIRNGVKGVSPSRLPKAKGKGKRVTKAKGRGKFVYKLNA